MWRLRILLFILSTVPFLIFSQNNSFVFNGLQYVDIGNQVATGCRTIEFWMQPNVTINPNSLNQFEIPIQRNNLASNSDEFAFVFNYSSVQNPGHLRFKVNQSNGIKHEVISDTNTWVIGKWYHVAAVLDPLNGISFFINGIKQRSTAPNYTQSISSSSDLIAVGCQGNLFTNFFNGRIDELRFSTTVRYSSNFTPSCRFTNDQFTRGLYNFDVVVNGNIAIDSSSNNFNGTVNGAFSNSLTACVAVGESKLEKAPIEVEFQLQGKHGYLSFKSIQDIKNSKVEVLDLLGNTVIEVSKPKLNNSLNFSHLKSGIYILRVIKNGELNYFKKLILL
ncbi:MAG: LamG-like jellyroll fold domain-containing protein [Vicingaceae bacterium]